MGSRCKRSSRVLINWTFQRSLWTCHVPSPNVMKGIVHKSAVPKLNFLFLVVYICWIGFFSVEAASVVNHFFITHCRIWLPPLVNCANLLLHISLFLKKSGRPLEKKKVNQFNYHTWLSNVGFNELNYKKKKVLIFISPNESWQKVNQTWKESPSI